MEGGKHTGLIVLIGVYDHLCPYRLRHPRLVNQVLVIGPGPFQEGVIALTRLVQIMPLLAGLIGEQDGVGTTNVIREPEVLGMVGDH